MKAYKNNIDPCRENVRDECLSGSKTNEKVTGISDLIFFLKLHNAMSAYSV
jgi:hypothetical protein